MKKLIILVVLLLLLTSCSPVVEKDPDKLLVYTSFYTMYDFTSKIGGDKITTLSLMPPGAEPHDWEPTPQQMKELDKADLFVYNGAGIEGWADSILASLDKDIPVVKTSEHLELLTNEEEDDHDHDHEGHDHGAYDPHTWLSPLNAKQEMWEIANALAHLDPDNAPYYWENYRQQAKRCLTLDSSIRKELENLPTRELVVAHAAYGYFTTEYGLTQVSVRGFSPESEPSPKRMAEVIDFIRDNHIPVIFYEENSPSDIVEAISRDTGAKYQILSPIESVALKDQEQGIDYYYLMERNLQTIKGGLTLE